jgi:hypothetical protein
MRSPFLQEGQIGESLCTAEYHRAILLNPRSYRVDLYSIAGGIGVASADEPGLRIARRSMCTQRIVEFMAYKVDFPFWYGTSTEYV